MMEIYPLSPRNAEAVRNFLLTHDSLQGQRLWLSRWNLLLWGYTLRILLSGKAGRHQPVIYVLQEQRDALGLAILRRALANRHRWHLERLALPPETPNRTELGFFLVSYLLSTYAARGAQTFTASLLADDAELLALLKACGFHQAMTCERYTLNETAHQHMAKASNAATVQQTLMQQGWRRLTPYYCVAAARHYNQQLPALWRSALERHPSIFLESNQPPNEHNEFWWLSEKAFRAICQQGASPPPGTEAAPSKSGEDCVFLAAFQYRFPPEGSEALPNVTISLYPASHADFETPDFMAPLFAYAGACWPNASLELAIWSYQGRLRQVLAPWLAEEITPQATLLVRDCRQRPQPGLNRRLAEALLKVESSSGGSASPA